MSHSPDPPTLRTTPAAPRRAGGDGRVAVGLTGGLSAGKSTALHMFAECGARTISADAVVHGLYERSAMAGTLAGRFGSEVVDSEGRVDRTALAARVAGDEASIRELELLVHPFVAQEIGAFISRAPRGAVSVCEVPLLFEGGLEELFDLVVTIEAAPHRRRERAATRMHAATFTALDARLVGSRARRAAADAVFVNEGGMDDLRAFVAGVYERARAMAAGQSGGEAGDD